MRSAGRRVLAGVAAYPELSAVVMAATLGLTVRSPFAWLASHQAINVLLALLVLATALGIEPAALRRLGAGWPRLLGALGTGIVVLPALSWLVAHLVAAGPLRDGVLTVGLASCEIASVATTAMAGGAVALSAGVLIGSTLVTVALAGPILAVEAGHARLHPASLVANLALVVAVPLAAGIALRATVPGTARLEEPSRIVSVVTVAALVAVIASEVHLSARYGPVALALVLFLAASALAGRLLGLGATPSGARALLLTTSMRDFAIAADLATTAFGPAAAAPLGLYGVLVLLWGTGAAGYLRRRSTGPVRGPNA